MPSDLVKSYAKKTGKKVSEIDSLWNKAEDIVKDEYDNIEVDSDRFYSLVNGTLKKMLKLEMAYSRLERFNAMYENTILKFEGMKNNEDEI